jgi:hypothetical protein
VNNGVKKTAFLFCAAVIAGIGIGIGALRQDTHEKIIKTMTKGEQAIERESLDEVMSIAALNYRDRYGFSYITLKRMFEDFFLRMSDISVEYKILKIETGKERSKALLDVTVTATIGGQRCYIIGSDGKTEALTLTFEKRMYKWLVASSEWGNHPTLEGLLEHHDLYYAPDVHNGELNI